MMEELNVRNISSQINVDNSEKQAAAEQVGGKTLPYSSSDGKFDNQYNSKQSLKWIHILT